MSSNFLLMVLSMVRNVEMVDVLSIIQTHDNIFILDEIGNMQCLSLKFKVIVIDFKFSPMAINSIHILSSFSSPSLLVKSSAEWIVAVLSLILMRAVYI